MHTHFLHSEQGGGSICAQFHNMLSARTAVQPVSQLTRKGLIESIRRVPFGHKWVDRQQAVKTYGRPYRQSSYASRTIFIPFFRALPHNLSAALCESFTLFRTQNLSQTALAPNCPVAPISYYTSTTAYIEVRQYGIIKQERFVREFCGPTRRDRSSRKKPQLSLFRAA